MCAYASMTATSSALALRTLPPSPRGGRGRPVTLPNAPKRTFVIERFIARPIISVSKVPDAPTSMPLTISTLFSSSKPVAAAARPVKAFSSEITTGMSAPPIGRTKRTPKSDAPATSAHSSHSCSTPATSAMPAATQREEECRVHELLARIRDRPAADQLLQLCERDHRAGERDRADQRREHDREADVDLRRPGLGRIRWSSASETSAAAPPPTPLNSATICGIAVIFTLAAPRRRRSRRRSPSPSAIAQ